IHAMRVHGILGLNLIQQREQQTIRPDLTLGTLRRDNDEWKVGCGGVNLWRAVLGHEPDIGAALASAVQEQNKRPAFRGIGAVAVRQKEKIIGVQNLFAFKVEFLGGLAGFHGGGVLGCCARGKREQQRKKEDVFFH